MATARNLAGISGLARPETQAAGTRALIEFLKRTSDSVATVTNIVSSGSGPSNHEDLDDMPSKTNVDHDDRYAVHVGATAPTDPVDGKLWLDTDDGGTLASGVGIPSGGTDEQILAKASGDDYDVEWIDAPAGGGGATTTDDYASRPTAGTDGSLFFPQDGIYVQRDNGVSWESWGPVWKCSPITLTDFTWVNQGTATATATGGSVYFYAPVGGSDVRALVKNVTGNYTVTVGFIPHLHGANYATIGLALRESSSGKLITGYLTQSYGLGVSKWDDENSYNAAYSISAGTYNNFTLTNRSPIVWLRFVDNGTNRIFSVSYNGLNWEQVHSVGRTDFCTCDQVGFYIDNNNATYKAFATFVHWGQT